MSLIIRNAKLRNKNNLVDIHIKDGKFFKMSSHIDDTVTNEIDAKGNLVSPPFIESHVHLDDALSAGNPRNNKSGTLQEAIQISTERKQNLTAQEVKATAKEVITWLLANGVLNIRAHTDFTENLTTFKAMLALKEEMKDYADIQIVAFPQNGIFVNDKTDELLIEAIKLGADVIGGLPQAEFTREDGIESIKYIFELANKYNRLIDIHTDETTDDQSRFLEVITKYTYKYKMGNRVTASHTTAMHNYNNDYAASLISKVKYAGMNIVTNPFSNTILQNRLDGYPKHRGITRIDELTNAGVNVSIGNDNIMDPFGPLGKGNMLQAAHLLAHTAHFTNHDQLNTLFDMITVNAAQTLNIKNYGIKEGQEANCIILDASNEQEAIRLTSECLFVIRKGKIISKTKQAERTLKLNNEKIEVNFKQ